MCDFDMFVPQAGGKGRSLRHVSLARAEPSTPETFRSFLSADATAGA